MKIPQWFVPKRRLLKVANERMQERLQYINIDTTVKSEDKALLDSYKESLARYAQKHNIAVSFKPNTINNSNTTQIHVYSTSLTPHAIKRQQQGLWYFATPEYKSSTTLNSQQHNNLFFTDLKNTISTLANSTKTPETNVRYPIRIRHENKYYDAKR